MLTKLQIFAEVKKILIESNPDLKFIGKNQLITHAFNLYNDLGMDSLDVYEFLIIIDKHFNISIPDNDAGNISTLSDVCACVQKELMKKQEMAKTLTKTVTETKKSFIQNIFTKTK